MNEESRVNSSSQISSVGFNTLKKLNTNSSASTLNSVGVTKPNSLSRLFTRNRSNTTLIEPGSDGEVVKDEEKLPDKGMFRLSKSMKRKPKKDLSVQTEPIKEIPSYTRKNSVNSPVASFQSFFQRSSSGITGNISGNTEFEDNPRSTITLSSGNSNSKITDPNIVKVFKFTDPINSLEEDIDDLESYKKIFLPADQFLRLKPLSSPTQSEHDDLHDEKFWSHLLTLVKPVILSSQQRKLSNGFRASQLIMTQEGISNYVRDNYTKNLKLDDEETNELLSREIAQDLASFFNKVVLLFLKDFKFQNSDDSVWVKLHQLWLYFRNKIFFFLVDCFCSINEMNGIFIELQSLILDSFKKIVIIPNLEFINTKQDQDFLRSYNDGILLSTMLQCFGLINSYNTFEYDKFSKTLLWLTTV